jgi:CRP-like cAMP-binding protein
MIATFICAIRSIVDLPVEEERKISTIATAQSLRKGDHFIRPGAIPTKFGFVVSGLFRYYYIHSKGSEYTKGFFPENNFITSYTSMKLNKPSYYGVEALEEATIVAVDYHHWKSLFDGHPCWVHFLLALLEKGYAKKEARERELLLLNAEERYRLFLENYPHLETRIKQHLIASYLGITPVALSRIRKTMPFADR